MALDFLTVTLTRLSGFASIKNLIDSNNDTIQFANILKNVFEYIIYSISKLNGENTNFTHASLLFYLSQKPNFFEKSSAVKNAPKVSILNYFVCVASWLSALSKNKPG